MSIAGYLRQSWSELLSAVQFLTRIPVPSHAYADDSLARSVKFFPVVGVIVGCGAALLHLAVASHVARPVAALIVVLYTVLITGGLHEDGLADAADAFGGGTSRDNILLILRDSRIGSYGGLALAFSVTARVLFIASLPLAQVPYYLIAAHVLCRWTTLPLSSFLSSARTHATGQGARIARLTSTGSLIGGTVFTFAVLAGLLKSHAIAPILTAMPLTWLSGVYYKRRIGGVTGDCFGATIQLAEIGVYLCGAWTP